MDATGQSLLKLLFNEGETVCVSNSKFGYHSIPLEDALKDKVTLYSPNPDVTTKEVGSGTLTLVAINPIKGFRQDSNVTAYRSFLFECDTGEIKDQLGYFKHLKVPLSAQIFSGNKSVHALVCLSADLDEKTYRYLYLWALNILTMCDQNCKNPSRSVRIPGAYREPKKKQRLIFMGKRIDLKDFVDWLNKYDYLRPKVRERKVLTGEGDYDKLSPWAKRMLKNGITFKNGRNSTWHALAVDFKLAGYTEEECIAILLPKFEEEHDFKEKELLVTINSGFKYEK